MIDLFDIKGHAILVTGGAAGIGKGVVMGLAEAGAHVIAWDVAQAALDETAAEAEARGLPVSVARVDVTDEQAVRAGIAAIMADHGRLDAAFINAGIAGKAGPAADMTLANWRNVHAVNLDGAFITAQAAIEAMKPAKRGKIVFTASVWGIRGARPAQVAAYMSSKGAIVSLTRQLALELAPHGINVNGIAPAGFLTALGAGELDPSFGDWLVGKMAMGRMVGPEEMVGPARFLASRASDWVTGHTLPVDGGYLAE
ncbi:SDR family NAD(P)-dependent oxidoreductase [Novosphingobium rosa]|uniref:SDR family NAD(P)-dependent oxidoreductase n=1 Tax=Novosphingobium rosa TaxID=76978 RepID=UPI0008347625|nr:SDR family oxidoreductase [Novosphingobium rosa]